MTRVAAVTGGAAARVEACRVAVGTCRVAVGTCRVAVAGPVDPIRPGAARQADQALASVARRAEQVLPSFVRRLVRAGAVTDFPADRVALLALRRFVADRVVPPVVARVMWWRRHLPRSAC